jgi:hypothetical protein
MAYIAVPTETLVAHLESMGFSKDAVARGREVTYSIAHKREPRLRVVVYTSVREGEAQVRARGKDAIRTCLVWTAENGKTTGVTKAKRVFRTGTVEGVLARLRERAREMYGAANRLCRSPRCPKCGAVTYHDSGKCVVYACRAGRTACAEGHFYAQAV